jgi:hypothetical protein
LREVEREGRRREREGRKRKLQGVPLMRRTDFGLSESGTRLETRQRRQEGRKTDF